MMITSLLLCTLTWVPSGTVDWKQIDWAVDGEQRTARVHMPELEEGQKAPLVFVWHGHGGNARGISRGLPVHQLWPEAIVVYPQGLKTPGIIDPEGKRSGWEVRKEADENKDLKFFDAMLADFSERGIIDEHRIHSTGHSNGGGFTYTLLFERGEVLASIGPSSAGVARQYKSLPKVQIPILHLAGREDRLVKMEWQQAVIDRLLKHNRCTEPKPWPGHKLCKLYPSEAKAPLVTYIHPGGHRMPKDAAEVFVEFLKQHPRPAPVATPDQEGSHSESDGVPR